MVGKTLKIDRSTSIYDKGGFARISVELDLQQPLMPSYTIFGEERPIVYEGLHQVCFSCGKYGHQKNNCPMLAREDEVRSKSGDKEAMFHGGAGNKTVVQDNPITNDSTVVTDEGGASNCSFGKLMILRRDFRNSAIKAGKKDENKGFPKLSQSKSKDSQNRISSDDNRKVSSLGNNLKGSRAPINTREVEGTMNKNQVLNIKNKSKDMVPHNQEWAQVGSKRKSENKGRARGKANKPPAREKPKSYSTLGRDKQPSISNSFSLLQEAYPPITKPDGVSSADQATLHASSSLGCVEQRCEINNGHIISEATTLDRQIEQNDAMVVHESSLNDDVMLEQDVFEGEDISLKHLPIISP